MKVLQNYVDGKFVKSKTKEFLDVENPGTGEIIAKIPMSTKKEVDKAVKSAHEAFLAWKQVRVEDRVGYLYKLRDKLIKNVDNLAQLNTEAHGKVLSEATGETKRLIQNVEAAIGVPHLVKGENFFKASQDVDVFSLYEPVGVFAHIAPFNFPAMIPFWFLPHAIACGASLIIKPSEFVPTVMDRIFELIDEIGLPPGVVSLIHGGREVSQNLIRHPDVAGICSVTSTPVARRISMECAEYGKRFLCQGGAKNFIVVSESLLNNRKVLDSAVKNAIDSVYGNTGQRCMAGSNIVCVGQADQEFIASFVKAAEQINVGYGLDPAANMGPLISKEAKEKVLGFIKTGIKEGARLVLDKRNVKMAGYTGHYLGPCVFTDVHPDMTIAREEIFGPVACFMRAKTLDDAIAMINAHTCKTTGWQCDGGTRLFKYGNSAMFYTTLGEEARRFKLGAECGDIGINIGLPAPIAYFPFGGMKDSFYGVLHGQSPDIIRFFMDIKVVTERWW